MAWRRCGALNSTTTGWPSRIRATSPPNLAELRLVAVGRIGRGAESDLFARYAARLRPPLAVTEIAEGYGSPVEIKRREAAAMLDALPRDSFVVALDSGATTLDSDQFSASMTQWRDRGKTLCFLIGGAEGLDRQILTRADHALSFGLMTWPHMLARVMLAEQLFRAQSIAANHPYHRAGRP